MTKTAYPITTLQPMQVLDFILDNQQKARVIFLPQPDHTGLTVGHVALAFVHAGMAYQAEMPGQPAPLSLDAAAQLAFTFAQKAASRVNAKISAAQLQGQEFLELADVQNITNGTISVTVV